MVEWAAIAALAAMCILGVIALAYTNFRFTRQLIADVFREFNDLRHRDYLAALERESRIWTICDKMANRVMARDYQQLVQGEQPPPPPQPVEAEEAEPEGPLVYTEYMA